MGITKRLIIPLNPPLGRGDLRPTGSLFIDKTVESRILKNMSERSNNQAGGRWGESVSASFFGFYFIYFRSLRPGA